MLCELVYQHATEIARLDGERETWQLSWHDCSRMSVVARNERRSPALGIVGEKGQMHFHASFCISPQALHERWAAKMHLGALGEEAKGVDCPIQGVEHPGIPAPVRLVQQQIVVNKTVNHQWMQSSAH